MPDPPENIVQSTGGAAFLNRINLSVVRLNSDCGCTSHRGVQPQGRTTAFWGRRVRTWLPGGRGQGRSRGHQVPDGGP